MGCFFGCFRVKDANPDLVSHPDNVVDVVPRSNNALSSLFQCNEENQNQLPVGLDVKELKNEAKFLKTRGTLPETHVSPVDIRKTFDNWEGRSCSLVGSPSSCITDGKNPRSDKQNVVTPVDMLDIEPHSETSEVQFKNMSVRFECESESPAHSSKGSSSECASQLSKQFRLSGNRSVTKPSSPYPIPLKLSDDMQTPLPSYTNYMDPGNITKVVNHVEGPSEMKDEYSDSIDKGEILKLNAEDSVMSTPMAESAVKECSNGKETRIEASLSDWLKPVSSMNGGNNERFGRISREKDYRGKTPGDRPILGMVAAHWNEDETSRISPKWWDGNGIPNSTNKYKEDQKVSWHVTPFEERLEKALSDETFISQRKPIDRMPPFDFDETEESDTAFSHLQSSDHIKPVVSF